MYWYYTSMILTDDANSIQSKYPVYHNTMFRTYSELGLLQRNILRDLNYAYYYKHFNGSCKRNRFAFTFIIQIIFNLGQYNNHRQCIS